MSTNSSYELGNFFLGEIMLDINNEKTQFRYGFPDALSVGKWMKENPDIVGLAFVGRSNVGKSSLINSLFGKKAARTSKTPGRTREINIFTFELRDTEDSKRDLGLPPLYLFDLPGYGHAKVSKEMSKQWDQLMQTFFKNLSNKVLLLNLQDARHPNQKVDIEFSNFIENFELNAALAFNKLDKLKTQKDRAALKKQLPLLLKKTKWAKFVYFVSAEKKTGVNELQEGLINHIVEATS